MEYSSWPPAAYSPTSRCGIVLAGGLGTRLGHLAQGVPKPLIEVAGRPFIEWVLEQLSRAGVGRFVISLGHLADAACRYFARRPPDGLELLTVREPQPLGTAGAVRYASRACAAENYLVANGDSLVVGDLAAAWSLLEDDAVDGVVVGVEVADASRYGSLCMDSAGRLRAFQEKRAGDGLVNAGVYLLRWRLVDTISERIPLSLEHEVFPEWLAQGARMLVHAVRGAFLDIGTPESLAQAADFVGTHVAWRVSA